ncbi:MAG: DUF1786 family protein [Desulfovibrionaceae bacterium]|nr:DUF1786 family protein [Desulfovibrionaceae bacterium]
MFSSFSDTFLAISLNFSEYHALYADGAKISPLTIPKNTPFLPEAWLENAEQQGVNPAFLATCAAAGEHPALLDPDLRSTFWRRVLEVAPDLPFGSKRLLRLRISLPDFNYDKQRIPCSVIPEEAALLHLAAQHRSISGRSARQGIILLLAGEIFITAFLLFRGQIFGIYEQFTSRLTTSDLLFDLQEFSRTWLPNESVQSSGGCCSLFRPAPDEAEGFGPIFKIGSRANLIPTGRLIEPDPHTQDPCRGLILAARE